MPITNPYHYRDPLTGTKGFYNRVSEMYLVTARIATEQPQSVSIIGGPRSGKTALINYLTEAFIREEYLTDSPSYVLVQLELGKSPPDCPKTFFLQISEALQQAGEAAIEPNTDGFDKAVKRLMKAKKKMVLFLDDFGTVTQNSRFALNFFSFLRSVANGSDVGYVTTSSLPLQELCHTEDIEDSPFFNIFTTVNLEPFSEEAARQLVQKPAEQVGQPFGEEVEWIWQLAGGFPQLLQLTAYTAFDHRNIKREKLAEQAYKNAEPYLEELWTGALPVEAQEVLMAVQAKKAIEPQLAYVAEDLESQGYLRQHDNGYVMGFELLEHFVAKRGSLWKRIFG